MVIAETARLRVRSWRASDAAGAHALWGDAEVMRHIGPPHADLARTRLALARAADAERAHGVCLWAVERRADAALVAACGFHPLPDPATLELAYHIARAAWGRGIATEAARACLDYARDRLAAHRVVAWSRPANAASLRVLAKLGFVAAGSDDGERRFELAL
jgi:RimJ/RimL family protein N-acetyltransferase